MISNPAVGTADVNADNPWPGLLAFREADEEYFKGRKTETEELFRLVRRHRVTVLFGLSGLGKSSLLQAGLFPRLRREDLLPVYIRLDFAAPEIDLAAQVFTAVRRSAESSRVEAPATQPGETLWEYFHRQGNDFWSPRNRPVLPLLVFDQFEEMFTLGRSDGRRARASDDLREQLADLAEGRPPVRLKARVDRNPELARRFSFTTHPCKILLSLREDFLPEMESLRDRMPSVALNRFRLRRMNGKAALLVVSQASHLIDEDVAEKVVRFVAADRRGLPLADLEVEPALLSVVCRELNNKRKGPKITAELLEGSHEQILTDLYEQSLADLPAAVRAFIEDRLLTVSGYRDSEALENALSLPGVTREAIDRLVNEHRLLRREERGGVQRVELTHDLLCGVVRASRDRRHEQEAAAEEERRRQAAAAAEKQQRDLRDLRRFRVAAVIFLALAVAASAATFWAVRMWTAAQAARNEAENARGVAETALETARQERERTQAAYDRIRQGLQIRQAALSGNDTELRRLLEELPRTTIAFGAKAASLNYRTGDGKQVYNIEIGPAEPERLSAGPDAVAFVTYLADHPTFRNTLMIAGAKRRFRISYNGWGCLTRVVALIEYEDPTRQPGVSVFDLCQALGW